MSFTNRLRTHHLMLASRAIHPICAAVVAVAAISLAAPSASAALPGTYITVYGGPTYTHGVGGFKDGGVADVNNAGTAIGYADKYDDSGINLGARAFRWDSSGAAATELGNLGTNASSTSYSYALAINDAGTAIGYSDKHDGSGVSQGPRAVRWDGSDTAATELGNLGTDSSGGTDSYTHAINNAGTAVGWVGADSGYRVVRWDGSGTVATELGHLHLGTNTNGIGIYNVFAINNAGTVVGVINKYDGSGVNFGPRAVRWDASGTAATELGNLGTDSIGVTVNYAFAINDAGTSVGMAQKYNGSGEYIGERAVRWDAVSTDATELGSLGTDPSGVTFDEAYSINTAGIAVGIAEKYDGAGTSLGSRPVYWGLDRVAVDLNTLVDPASGWTLNSAGVISDTGWIGGGGMFDPDGVGGQEAYQRMFLMHVPATAVPEPATVALFGVAVVGLVAASRRRVRQNVALHLKPSSHATRIVCAATSMAITLSASSVSFAHVNIYGGPSFISVDGSPGGGVIGVNDAGVAIGNVTTEESALENTLLAVRWDGSAAPAIELGLGVVHDINEAGTAVGDVPKFLGTGDQTSAAVRWDPSGATTELMILGTPPCCGSFAYAYSINDGGTAVGWTEKYNGAGLYQGFHAVRWDATGTAATELGYPVTSSDSYARGYANDINNAGTIVGGAAKYNYAGSFIGQRVVRWDASTSAATELGDLGTTYDHSNSFAFAINASGTAVGSSDKQDGTGGLDGYVGELAVRWDASGTAATELGNLGLNHFGPTFSRAVAINAAGTAVGYAKKFGGAGEEFGLRAVRWDALGTAVTELGNLGTNGGVTETNIYAINDAGIAVGYADDYDGSGTNFGERAVYWGLDGAAVDLNTLIDPASGWTLNQAHAVSNTGWIGGSGLFDLDGAGGQEAYARLFLIQLPAPSVLPGDYDGSGIVGPEDYDLWKANFGSTTMLAADGNGNHIIDAADYAVWRNNLGATLPGVGSAGASPSYAATPEPSVFALSFVAICSFSNCRRWQRRQ